MDDVKLVKRFIEDHSSQKVGEDDGIEIWHHNLEVEEAFQRILDKLDIAIETLKKVENSFGNKKNGDWPLYCEICKALERINNDR